METPRDFREIAHLHHSAAKRLLQKQEVRYVRYACLELRLAIEALVFELLEVYLSEVSNSVMKKWTPRKIMDELLRATGDVDSSITIHVAVDPAGDDEDEDNWMFAGTEYRFTAKWADKAHNALSNFLHIPTLKQQAEARVPNAQSMKSKAQDIFSELDKVFEFKYYAHKCGSVI